MLFVGENLAAFVGFVMLVAVSTLSVPGLLDYYEVVESDAGRRVFKLNVIVKAENFNLNAKFVNFQYLLACDKFIANTTGNIIELWLKRKVDLRKEDRYTPCNGVLRITVDCKSASGGANDCDPHQDYHINLRVKHYVSFCIVFCVLTANMSIHNISFAYTIVGLITACPT